MKPLVIIGTAIAGGLLVFFVADEAKRKKLQANLALDGPKNDSESDKLSEEDLDLKVRELRKALRHAERERKAQRNSRNPSEG